MFRIAEGSSLSTTIASIFGNAIRSAYPAIPIPISNGLVRFRFLFTKLDITKWES